MNSNSQLFLGAGRARNIQVRLERTQGLDMGVVNGIYGK